MTDQGEDTAGDRAADGDGADGDRAGDRDADDGAGNGRAAADGSAPEAAADEREAAEAPDDRSAAEAAPDDPAAEDAARSDRGADRRPASSSAGGEDDDGGSFLGNLTSPKKQLGEAAAAFRNARGAGGLPRDEEDRVKLVCRRYAERRAVPLDDLGRPSCFDEDHPDCQGCLEDVRDGTVETW